MGVLCYFLLVLPILLFLLKRYLSNGAKLPPGPSQLPIIGSLHHFIRGPLLHRRLRELATTYGPLMHLKLGEVDAIVVSSSEVAMEMLKTHDVLFSERPAFTNLRVLTYQRKDISYTPYGGYWRQMRKICTVEMLNAARVQSFRSIREHEVSRLVRSVYSTGLRSPVNLSEELILYTANVVTCAALGRQCTDKKEMVSLMMEALLLLSSMDIRDLFPSNKVLGMVLGAFNRRVHRIHREVDRMFDRVIDEHKRRKFTNGIGERTEDDEDFLEVLLRHQEEDILEFPLSTDHIKATIFEMLGGAMDSSTSALVSAMTELMRNPTLMQRAQTEVREAMRGKGEVTEEDIPGLHFMRLVIKETLRLHPPGPLLAGRWCRETCTIGGYTILEKSVVLVNVWAIGRDPRHWDDPESFRPERFDGSPVDYKGTNFEYLPFGAGRRMCPGIQFGMVSLELALAALLFHFDWKLPDGMEAGELDITERSVTGSSRKSHLFLIAIPR